MIENSFYGNTKSFSALEFAKYKCVGTSYQQKCTQCKFRTQYHIKEPRTDDEFLKCM